MRLHALLRSTSLPFDPATIPDLAINLVQEDSRLVRPGDLFIARPGTKTDGSKFAFDAQLAGAVAVVTSRLIEGLALPQIVADNIPAVCSTLAHANLDNPSHFMKVLGVTGTNGKTTIAYLLRHILAKNSRKCGMIGTVEIDDGASRVESNLTTPGAVEVAQMMAAMRGNRCAAVAIETSSHALHQDRVAGVRFAGAGFTNLTGDHLDYHKTMEEYARAKARLFSSLDETAVAAINIDDPWHELMMGGCGARIVTFSQKIHADYQATDIAVTAQGTHFILIGPDGRAEVSMQLIGKHNVENALCASVLAAEVFGLTVHQIAAALRDATGAPGRLQRVPTDKAFSVLVDYAHTHDALENVLKALRPLTKNKLKVLFGCGGDRDSTKRPKMAAVAQALADEIFITSDNPRTEDPQTIINQITAGLSGTKNNVHINPDRRTAIRTIIDSARDGDVLLLAGKGHENYQILGTTKHHFDDLEEAAKAMGTDIIARV